MTINIPAWAVQAALVLAGSFAGGFTAVFAAMWFYTRDPR